MRGDHNLCQTKGLCLYSACIGYDRDSEARATQAICRIFGRVGDTKKALFRLYGDLFRAHCRADPAMKRDGLPSQPCNTKSESNSTKVCGGSQVQVLQCAGPFQRLLISASTGAAAQQKHLTRPTSVASPKHHPRLPVFTPPPPRGGPAGYFFSHGLG